MMITFGIEISISLGHTKNSNLLSLSHFDEEEYEEMDENISRLSYVWMALTRLQGIKIFNCQKKIKRK